MMTADESVRWLNSSGLIKTPRNIRQPDNAPLGLGGWYFKIFPTDSEDLYFCEARIREASQWIGCPNCPDWYVISNRGKNTRFQNYGRAIRFFAELVRRRNVLKEI